MPTERQDLEYMLLLGSVGRLLWCSWAGLISLNQNSKVLVSSKGSYISNTQGEAPGRQGRLLITRATGEMISETYICLGFCGLLPRACIA